MTQYVNSTFGFLKALGISTELKPVFKILDRISVKEYKFNQELFTGIGWWWWWCGDGHGSKDCGRTENRRWRQRNLFNK
jgi:hypothetical protein